MVMAKACNNKKPPEVEIQFYLNQQFISVSNPNPTETLLDFLRLNRKLTGTKEGCAEGDCGACTVLVGKINEDGELIYKTANSCIIFLPSLAYCHVISVEGLTGKSGELHPVQEAMIEASGAQCGFCTPGFVMSLYGLWLKESKPSKQRILDSLQGNLCRCTGYGPIIEAAFKATESGSISRKSLALQQKNWKNKLTKLMNRKESIVSEIPKCFFLPKTISELKTILSHNKDGTIVAGSTDIGLWVNKSFMNVKPMIFIGQINELKRIETQSDKIVVGAMVSYTDLLAVLPRFFPELKQYINQIGGDQIRNMGTIGGNIANGSPIGDMAPILIALGAKMALVNYVGSRTIKVESFFQSYGCQDLKPGEFIHYFEIPLKQKRDTKFRAYKVAKRRYEDITIVSAAFNLEFLAERQPRVRFAFGGMAEVPKRALTLEKVFEEQADSLDQDVIISEAIGMDFNPLTDCRGSSEFRLKLAQNLFKKFAIYVNEGIEIDIEKGP
ncbi:MAG: xanthine dehydrogenase small subunit [Rhodobacteraceae bacterium]|nr:MAG: xanthine dehydrogenase small subunit [Paracoccaceae bacterium]